jgi:hypothetical protein
MEEIKAVTESLVGRSNEILALKWLILGSKIVGNIIVQCSVTPQKTVLCVEIENSEFMDLVHHLLF